MERGTRRRAPAGALLPRGLHPASQIAAIGFGNRRVVFGILFKTVAETLRTIAADPRHGGMRIGGTAVLHTWGPEAPLPSPSARGGAQRGLRCRERRVEDRERHLLRPRQGPGQLLSPPLPRRVGSRPWPRRAGVPRHRRPSRQPRRVPTPHSPPHAAGTGWSTPSGPSAGLGRCSDTSPATPTGSQSPTAASRPSTARPSPSGTESPRGQGRASPATAP